MGLSVRIRLFAQARAAVGRPTLDWPVEERGIPAAELVRALGNRYPDLRRTLAASRFVRNGKYLARLSETLRPGDELSVHPPYGGG